MDGVRDGWALIPENDPNGGIGAKVMDVPFWMLWERGIPRVGKEEDRHVEVGAEGAAVHEPRPEACGVSAKCNINCLGRWR